VPSSRTVRVLEVAGSVSGVQAVTALPSTAATAGALGSAALAVTGRQRAWLSASGPAVRVPARHVNLDAVPIPARQPVSATLPRI
jgi:hypothetical protein